MLQAPATASKTSLQQDDEGERQRELLKYQILDTDPYTSPFALLLAA
jgi:hypothetical protein